MAFTDDDCYVAPDYIDSVVAAFSGNPRLGYVAGRVLLHDPTDCRITVTESNEACHYPAYCCRFPARCMAANMGFRRAALQSIGGFDNDLGAGTRFIREDTDAIARASLAGWEGTYDPRPTVSHQYRLPLDPEAGHTSIAILRRCSLIVTAGRPPCRSPGVTAFVGSFTSPTPL